MAWYSLDSWDAAGASAEWTKVKLESVATAILILKKNKVLAPILEFKI